MQSMSNSQQGLWRNNALTNRGGPVVGVLGMEGTEHDMQSILVTPVHLIHGLELKMTLIPLTSCTVLRQLLPLWASISLPRKLGYS